MAMRGLKSKCPEEQRKTIAAQQLPTPEAEGRWSGEGSSSYEVDRMTRDVKSDCLEGERGKMMEAIFWQFPSTSSTSLVPPKEMILELE